MLACRVSCLPQIIISNLQRNLELIKTSWVNVTKSIFRFTADNNDGNV